MITHFCDRCGNAIEGGAVRYIARIEVFAAADPLVIDLEDLLRDHRKEMDRLLEACKDRTEEELMRDVYVRFQYDLCRDCQRSYVADPLTHKSG